ncbi:HNH endonuclease family protein [Nonomuraea sp. NPDC052129]|uniref:HNH endonuclease family protein n=1 Tax=Nonomuraea sp. NPDC052129 TaxID=3154651 RepID=UPI0034148041
MPVPIRHTLTAIAALLTTTLAIGNTPATAAARTSPAATVEGPLLEEAVQGLPTAVEDRTGYKRTSFKHWIDVDRDGCDTRAEVLIDEATTPPDIGPGCVLTGGTWNSYYDDQLVDAASKLDVDHLVPLAEAWDSGAHAWDAAQRQAYANDLDEPWHLVAVTARSNRQKADKDPAQWLPPHEPARCRYAAEWTAVKLRWHLSVDPAEKDALAAIARTCPDQPLPSPDR